VPFIENIKVDKELVPINPQEIHIWIGDCQSNKEAYQRMLSILSPFEIQRADAFHFNRDRENYVQAHTFLRLILSKYSGVRPQKIDFELGAYGKPYLKCSNHIHFNLSHTKEMIAIAVSSDSNVGIDIEKQDHVDDIKNVARQFMSDTELRDMGFLEASFSNTYFYQCWVQKEALAKASGMGVGDHLRAFSVMNGFRFERGKTISTCFEEAPKTWWLKTFELVPDHLGAVCIESSDTQTYSIKLKYDEGQFSA
jgi:4'-phosphopantetheinyl transferase